jgi:hypothetical protein
MNQDSTTLLPTADTASLVGDPNPETGTPTEGASDGEGSDPDAAATKVKAPVGLTLTGDGLTLKPIKYPMPLRAPRFNLVINGKERSAAQTTFRDIRYTYFEYEGASFYVPGHLAQEPEYTLTYSEGYVFTPAKLDRKQQAAAAAAAKKAKDGATPDGSAPATANADAETALQASGAASGDEGSSPAAEAPAEADAAPAEPKRKAKR